jgi:hypothetical protein
MSQKNADFEYVPHIKGHSKEGMKEQDVRAIADFYNPQISKVKGPERIFVNGKFKRPK